MKIVKTKIKDLVLVKTNIYKDNRGYFKEVEKNKLLKKKFVFDCFSFSKKNTLRGLHLQLNKSQAKIISVVHGKILDVVVDLRKKSKTFGKYFSCILSEYNFKSIYIPPGFAHGFMTLEKENYVLYSCTKYRSAQSEKSIKFNDKNLKIRWPLKKPILSKRDKNAMDFNMYKNKNLR